MTIALTTNVNIPNVNRIRVKRFVPDDGQGNAMVVVVAVTGGGGNIESHPHTITLRDVEQSGVVMANATPTGLGDVLVPGASIVIPNAASDAEAAYRSGNNKAAALRALETLGISVGWIHASLGGTVS